MAVMLNLASDFERELACIDVACMSSDSLCSNKC